MAPDFISALLSCGSSRASQYVLGSQAANVHEQHIRLIVEQGQTAVLQDVETLLQQLSPQAPKALKVILQATRATSCNEATAPADAAACSSLRSAVFAALPGWLHSLPEDQQQLAADLAAAFLPELDTSWQQQATDLSPLLYACLSGLEESKPHCLALLELLPPCLAAICASPSPANDLLPDAPAGAGRDTGEAAEAAGAAAEGEATAAFYKDQAANRLLNCGWEKRPEQVGQLLQLLKALPLTQEQLEKAVKKGIMACRAASLQQLPPIMYQVLLLSARGARQLALTGLRRLFNFLELQPQHQAAQPGGVPASSGNGSGPLPGATLLQVEATLLMHISTLLKYDAALGSEWHKWFKTHGVSGDHFMLQVLLTMSRHHKLEQPLQQLLKKAVQQACEDEAAAGSGVSSSRWMAALPAVGSGPSLKELEQGLLKTVRCSSYACELVCPGLLQLASNLLTTPCSCPLHVVMAARGGKAGSLPPQASPGARAVRLGLLLLQEIFEVHAEARTEVLKVAQGQLACGNLDAALPHVLLLSSICREQPALLSSYVPQLKDCLCSVAGLSADAALVLLLALWPLCRVHSDLQDHVIMLLRKMMYRQDVGGRLVAIRGFLCLILQHLADAPTSVAPLSGSISEASCSQASLSQVSSLSGGRGINLLQELAAVLRRALTQQAPVREALYRGLLQVLDADPGSHELLSELLLPHLRTFVPDSSSRDRPPLLLHQCAGLVHGKAVLHEPLPVLLRCVHQLATMLPGESGSDWAGPSDQHSSSALKACFAALRSRLSQASLDDFGLGQASDLNPLLPDGLLGQMHASNLLGALQVVMEDVVADVQQLKDEQPDAASRDPERVAQLGEEMLRLFELHNSLACLALEGSKAPSKKGGKKGAAAAAAGGTAPDAGGEQQAPAGQKRGKPSPSFTPVTRQQPHLSATCLAALCTAINEDGLLQLPDGYDESRPAHHQQLARNDDFRSFVLRSCCNLLEGAAGAAAASALLQPHQQGAGGSGSSGAGGAAVGPAADEVLVLGPALFQVFKLIMDTTVPGGRSASSSSSSAAGSSEGHETLEQLSANALQQLLKLADATQQLAALFKLLPLEDGSLPPHEQRQQQQQDKAAAAAADDEQRPAAAATAGAGVAAVSGAAVVAAVMPRLPQLTACIDKLMLNSCFKEAQTCVECLVLLGRQLNSPPPAQPAAAAAGTSAAGLPAGAARQQQQQQLPAHAQLSKWASESALQQEEPEVKSVSLAKALLDVYIRFCGADDLVPLKTAALEIQTLVGDCETDTQATQQQPRNLAMLLPDKTAQPCAAAVLAYIDEGLGQVERLAACHLKAGLVQDSDTAEMARDRRRVAAVLCKRLQGLLEALAVLVNTIMAMPVIVDHQTRVLIHTYKLLLLLAKAHQLPKSAANRALPPEFDSLASMVNRDLTHRVYHFMIDDQEVQQQQGAKVKLARVKREAKQVPALVFSIESWEKQLAATGKAAGKNLLKDAKRASIRDFKIKQREDGEPMGAAAAAGSGGRGGRGAGRGRSSRGGGRASNSGGSRGGGSSGGGQGGQSSAAAGSEAGAEDEVMGEADEANGAEVDQD